MNSRINRRLVALAFVFVAGALMQGCAVTTGAFSPSRSVSTNRSMVSHYDVTRQQSSTPVHHMAVSGSGGVSEHRYY
jgi:hypothetical protein